MGQVEEFKKFIENQSRIELCSIISNLVEDEYLLREFIINSLTESDKEGLLSDVPFEIIERTNEPR